MRAALEDAGALEYTTIVASPASDPAGFKYLAPYTGSAIGQHWMYDGKHVLIVFDDLSKQAEAYRAMSLLLRRPPGREAYPGDVFYLHSRLLERCAKLSDDLGAGSMTGLPIVETKANDVSAFIPTNVISITDGQCFLETDLFNSGVRPAVNVGTSVSRVGGSAQIKAMRQVSGSLRVDLAQFRDLEAFAAFASDLDDASKAQLARGQRMVELLKQGQYAPYPIEDQVVSIWAGTSGELDEVPVEDVRRFEREFLDYLTSSQVEILTAIVEKPAQICRTRRSRRSRRATASASRDSRVPRTDKSRAITRRAAVPSDDGRELRHGSPTPCLPAAHRVRLRHEEDHPRAGADRHRAHRQGAAARGGVDPVRRRDHPGGVGGGLVLQRQAPARPASAQLRRAAIVLITSDRGFAGAYNSAAIKQAEQLAELLRGEGKEVVRYVIGRKGVGVLPVPGSRTRRVLDRLLRQPAVRRRRRSRTRDRRFADRTGGRRGGRVAHRLHRSSSRC